MPLHQPSVEQALRQLAQSTGELSQAAQAGDLGAAGLVLAKRKTELAALEFALQATRLDTLQLAQFDQIVRQGDEAVRCLAGRRETVRAQVGELEAQRRQLGQWRPQRPVRPARLDLSG